MKLKFFYSKMGKRFVKRKEIIDGDDTDRYQLYLAGSLGSAAADVEQCDEILRAIGQIESGEETEAFFGANDDEWIISRDSLQVNLHVNDEWIDQPEGQFSLEQVKAVVTAWKKFLEMPASLETELTVDV